MNPVNSYLDQYVITADPVELVRMLYQRAIALVRDARRHLAARDVLARSNAILKAYDILLELIGSLRDEVAPDLCRQLRSLYLYMQQRLLDGNVIQEEAPLNEVLRLLITLGEGWTSIPESKDSRAAETHAEPALSASEHPYLPPVDRGNRTVAQSYAA